MLWSLLPALTAFLFLLVVSLVAFGNPFRPGLWLELLIVYYASCLLLRMQRDPRRAGGVLAVLVAAFYGATLLKWVWFEEALRLTDVSAVPELLAVLPWSASVPAGVAALVTVLMLTGNVKLPAWRSAAVFLLPLLVYAALVFFAPATLLRGLEWLRPERSHRAHLEPWRNGPTFTLLREVPRLFLARRLLHAHVAAPANTSPSLRLEVLQNLPPLQRNLYVVLLESFVDPLGFRAHPLPSDPLDRRFRQWLDAGESVVLSACFGGQSARAELETLCGVPSYGVLGVELPLLRGGPMPCLPRVLAGLGYTSMVDVPVAPSFFNVGDAYDSAGFTIKNLAEAFVLDDLDGDWLSDASLFRQTLGRIEAQRRTGKPLFSYVVTWSGHAPFDLNPALRPPRYDGTSLIDKLADAAHYNSAAAADFVERIEAQDPEAVIAILADHLPVVAKPGAEGDYRWRGAPANQEPTWLESRAVPLVVRRSRQTVRLGVVPQYLLPEALLDLLTDGAYCRAGDCFHKRPLIYRPNGTEPVFTTTAGFPLPICGAGPMDATQPCAAAVSLHEQFYGAYLELLRVGMQERALGVDQ